MHLERMSASAAEPGAQKLNDRIQREAGHPMPLALPFPQGNPHPGMAVRVPVQVVKAASDA